MEEHTVVVVYTNWRGETAPRRILPHAGTLRFTATEHHHVAQWVFDATDVERGVVRTFALAGLVAEPDASCVVSAPPAAIEVTELELTTGARAGLRVPRGSL